MIHKTYKYQPLNPDGSENGEAVPLSWRGVVLRVSIECPAYDMGSLSHMIAVCEAAKGHPVELTHWNKEKSGLLWAARISLLKDSQLELRNLVNLHS